jgi:hypothetical protein
MPGSHLCDCVRFETRLVTEWEEVGGDERTVDLTDIIDQVDHVVIYKGIGGDE